MPKDKSCSIPLATNRIFRLKNEIAPRERSRRTKKKTNKYKSINSFPFLMLPNASSGFIRISFEYPILRSTTTTKIFF